MMNLILQIFQKCGFATVNRNDWIEINMLVVIFSIMISSLIYLLANFLPRDRMEKLRGIANYEILEAFFSIVIIAFLIFTADLVCQIGGLLVGQSNYIDLFTSIDGYIGNLLFVNGINIVSKLYTISIQYTEIATLSTFLLNYAILLIQGLLGIGTIVPNLVTITFSANIDALLSSYSGIFTNMYGSLIATSFGGLFILFIAMPIIEAGAMTVLAPLSIIFRSFSFVGPQLRKTSNLLLAMAIGLYFILPLTITFDSYIAGCLGIGLGIKPVPLCSDYPSLFSQYLTGYSVNSVSPSLFTSPVSNSLNTTGSIVPNSIINQVGSMAVPTNFWGKALNLNGFYANLTDAPGVTATYGKIVASYLFLGIVLLAIDSAITLGFVAGLARGLDAMSNLFGVGGFWRE
jgi:hypothetical protein